MAAQIVASTPQQKADADGLMRNLKGLYSEFSSAAILAPFGGDNNATAISSDNNNNNDNIGSVKSGGYGHTGGLSPAELRAVRAVKRLLVAVNYTRAKVCEVMGVRTRGAYSGGWLQRCQLVC